MDVWLFEIFNSFEEQNKNNLINFFLTIGVATITYLIPAGWGKPSVIDEHFAKTRLFNEGVPRLIVAGTSFYLTIAFLVRSSASENLFRGVIVLILITAVLWIFSLFFTSRNQKLIEDKEATYKRNQAQGLTTNSPITTVLLNNGMVLAIWFTVAIGFCLSKPLNISSSTTPSTPSNGSKSCE